jgi:hypothetical protein
MKHAIEMGSDAMIYVLSSIKIGSCIQKLIGGIHRLIIMYITTVRIIRIIISA